MKINEFKKRDSLEKLSETLFLSIFVFSFLFIPRTLQIVMLVALILAIVADIIRKRWQHDSKQFNMVAITTGLFLIVALYVYLEVAIDNFLTKLLWGVIFIGLTILYFWVEEVDLDSERVQNLFLTGAFIIVVVVFLFTPSANLGARISWVTGLISLTCVYIIAMAGLDIHTGRTGIINFGVIFFIGIGGTAAGVLVGQEAWNPWVVMGLAAVAAFVIGYLLAYPTVRLRSDYFAIVTITLGEVLRVLLAAEPYLQDRTSLPGSAVPGLKGVSGPYEWLSLRIVSLGEWFSRSVDILPFISSSSSIVNLSWGTLGLPIARALVAILVAIAILLILAIIYKSPYGRLLKAIREDEEVVEAYGYNVFQIKAVVLGIGAVIISIAGTLFIWQTENIGAGTLRPTLTFLVWGAFIVGGGGNIRGVIVGGFVLITSINVFNNDEIQTQVQRTAIDEIHRIFVVDIYEWGDWIFETLFGPIIRIFSDEEEIVFFGSSAWTFFWPGEVSFSLNILSQAFLGLLIVLVLLLADRGLIPERLYRPDIPDIDFASPIFAGYDKGDIEHYEEEERQLPRGEVDKDVMDEILQRKRV